MECWHRLRRSPVAGIFWLKENMPVFNYQEQVESLSPTSIGCSLESGKSTITYLLENPVVDQSQNDLQAAILEILGSVNYPASADGRLARTPPLAHPLFPFWMAVAIPGIKGLGEFTKTDAVPGFEVAPFPEFALYKNYWLSVEFQPLPFPVCNDVVIQVRTGGWYDDTSTTGTPSRGIYRYAEEWNRFTDYDFTPQFENITAQKGNMKFNCSANPPNTHTFPAMPRVFLPNQMLKITWYRVPYRFITSTNSYITRMVGRVNQNPWNNGIQQFAPGTLLYLSYNAKRYTPPIQTQIWNGDVFTYEKYVNLEFVFSYTTRLAGATVSTAPPSQNFIAAGHNLQNWLSGDRKFYYVESAPTTGSGIQKTPIWRSAPIELLFTDPDSPQPGGDPLANLIY